jgi:hypothetical protein
LRGHALLKHCFTLDKAMPHYPMSSGALL